MVSRQKIQWPNGKDFAFTMFDDTDLASIANVSPVYSFLEECGFRTTKSAWVLPEVREEGKNPGSTCDDLEYLRWLLQLQDSGFEISSHMATYHSSFREETKEAHERFKLYFGDYPRSHANHTGCVEAIYWAEDRLSCLNRHIYNVLTRYINKNASRGHVEGDPYFWGDFCRDHIKYVRNFTFDEINTLKICPVMPYHDPAKEYVNYWFASTDGSTVQPFNNVICEVNQDRLENEGGACIMYTHLASGFFRDGRLNPRFELLMRRLSNKNGWFVPVSELLDFLLSKRRSESISLIQKLLLEVRWLLFKASVRSTT